MKGFTCAVGAVGVLCAFLGLASPANADSISVFSTGVDSSSNLLAPASVDPHYVWSYGAGTVGNFGDPYNPATSTFFSAPNYPTTFSANAAYVTPVSAPDAGNAGFWNVENPHAESISFNNIGGGGGDVPFTYETTFDLTGLDPSTASIDLTWFVDDWGVIALNGNVLDIGPGTFSIDSDFVSGINTLDFVTYNGGGPGGISVQINSADADPAPVPEPATLVMVGLGVSALLRRRFSRNHHP